MVDTTTYIKALVQYYGFIPHEKASEIHQIHFGKPMDPSFFTMDFGGNSDEDEFDFLDGLVDEDLIHNRHGLFYSDQAFFDPDHVADYIRQKLAEPWHIPELEEMLRYAGEDYVEENEAFHALDQSIRQHAGSKLRQPADTFAPLIANFLRHQFDIPLILEEVQQYGLKFTSMSLKTTFRRLIGELADQTRLWELNGFSPKALRELKGETLTEPEGEVVIQEPAPPEPGPEVGRNDSCPCGSGKKYKKCCGMKK